MLPALSFVFSALSAFSAVNSVYSNAWMSRPLFTTFTGRPSGV